MKDKLKYVLANDVIYCSSTTTTTTAEQDTTNNDKEQEVVEEKSALMQKKLQHNSNTWKQKKESYLSVSTLTLLFTGSLPPPFPPKSWNYMQNSVCPVHYTCKLATKAKILLFPAGKVFPWFIRFQKNDKGGRGKERWNVCKYMLLILFARVFHFSPLFGLRQCRDVVYLQTNLLNIMSSIRYRQTYTFN